LYHPPKERETERKEADLVLVEGRKEVIEEEEEIPDQDMIADPIMTEIAILEIIEIAIEKIEIEIENENVIGDGMGNEKETKAVVSTKTVLLPQKRKVGMKWKSQMEKKRLKVKVKRVLLKKEETKPKRNALPKALKSQVDMKLLERIDPRKEIVDVRPAILAVEIVVKIVKVDGMCGEENANQDLEIVERVEAAKRAATERRNHLPPGKRVENEKRRRRGKGKRKESAKK
jgi:hypothetical protein